MPETDDEESSRKRRTFYLLIAAACCLILPLLGIMYIRINDSALTSVAAGPGALFRNRGPLEPQVGLPGSSAPPTPAPAPPSRPRPAGISKPAAASPGSSLNFVRGGRDYYQDGRPANPSPTPTPSTPPQADKPAPTHKIKPAPKPFSRPSIKPISGFSGLRNGGSMPGGDAQIPDVGAALKSLPAGTLPPGTPDISKLLQKLPAEKK